MAVTLTVDELREALRAGDSDTETADLTRRLEYAIEAVGKYVPGNLVPSVIGNEAVIRLAGYLYDKPNATRGDSFANAMRNSGAAAALLPYRKHRAGHIEDAPAAEGEPTGAGLFLTWGGG